VITAGQWSSSEVYGQGSTCTPTEADIVVTATDDVQLADVAATSSTAGTSVVFVSSSNGAYTFRFSGTNAGPNDIPVTVTFTASDTSGNTANTARGITLHPVCFIIF
jgi:hypothetical protein